MISIVVPFSPGTCPHRDRAWAWISARLRHFHPDHEIVTGTCEGVWSKGSAVADAVARSTGEILVVHDADVYTSPEALDQAVQQVTDGAPWVVPHMLVWRLAEDYSAKIMARPPQANLADRTRRQVVRYRYPGVAGGGITVLARETYERVPIDPRFVGWGGEDVAWGKALDALVGRHERGSADLIHLWHPPQASHRDLKAILPETQALDARYKEAGSDPGQLAQILQEVVA